LRSLPARGREARRGPSVRRSLRVAERDPGAGGGAGPGLLAEPPDPPAPGRPPAVRARAGRRRGACDLALRPEPAPRRGARRSRRTPGSLPGHGAPERLVPAALAPDR